MNDQEKKSIRKFLYRAFTGRITLVDLEKVWEKVEDYKVEDWKKLKNVLKDVIKEWWDSEIQPFVFVIAGNDLKEDVRNLVHATIDFKFVIFNENVFYQFVQLKKQSDLSTEQKVTKAFLSLIPGVKKIIDQRPQVTNYHQTETTLVDKYNKLISIIYKKPKNKEEEIAQIKSVGGLLENISTDETIVLKKKLKPVLLSAFAKISSSKKLQNINLIAYEKPFKLVLDLIDTIFEEKVVRDVFVLLKKIFESAGGDYSSKFLLEKMKEVGIPELKRVLSGLTSHLNKLVVGASDEQISPTEAEEILNRTATNIQQILPNNPPPRSPDNPNYIEGLVSAFTDSLNDSRVFLGEQFRSEFSTVKSKVEKPWYKEPWKVVPLGVAGLLVIGFSGWLFFRKRSNRAKYD